MRIYTLYTALALAAGLLPLPAFAQLGPDPDFGPIGLVIENTLIFVNSYLIPGLFAIAFLFFLWGMFKFFFLSGANEEGRSQGKQLALWSVIAFVIMVSLWGLVNVVAWGFGFYGASAPTLPTVPTSGGGAGGGSGSGNLIPTATP